MKYEQEVWSFGREGVRREKRVEGKDTGGAEKKVSVIPAQHDSHASDFTISPRYRAPDERSNSPRQGGHLGIVN